MKAPDTCNFTDAEAWEQLWSDPANNVSVQRRAGKYRLVHPLGFSVDLDSDLRAKVRRPAHLSKIFCDQYVEEQVEPRVRAHRGEFVLHAATVQLNEKSVVLLLGETGRGKSTLAASFHLDGLPLLGDDAVEILDKGGLPTCRSLNRSVRLNEDSAAQLSQLRDFTTAPSVGPKVRFVTADDEALALTEPKTVRALFVLEASGATLPKADRLPPSKAAIAIVTSSFALDPSDKLKASERMAKAAWLAERVPVFGLAVPHDFGMLSVVKRLVLNLTVHSRPDTASG